MTQPVTQPDGTAPQPLIGHLTELRTRLLWVMAAMLGGTIVCYFWAQPIYGFLVQPLADAMGDDATQRLIYTSLAEAFMTYIKVAFFAGTFLTFPVLLVQIWRFIAPGLYRNEKATVLPFLLATPLLFFLGGVVVYCLILPFALPFFLSFQSTAAETVLPIQLEARVGDYLDLVMALIFAFGLCFQLPVVMGLLAKAGVIDTSTLPRLRRYAVVVVFIVAAVLTPPDVVSQIALAVPLLALYEVSVLLVRFLGRHDKRDA